MAKREPRRNAALDENLPAVLRSVMRRAQHSSRIGVVIAALRAKLGVMEIHKDSVATPWNHASSAIAAHDLAPHRWRHVLPRARVGRPPARWRWSRLSLPRCGRTRCPRGTSMGRSAPRLLAAKQSHRSFELQVTTMTSSASHRIFQGYPSDPSERDQPELALSTGTRTSYSAHIRDTRLDGAWRTASRSGRKVNESTSTGVESPSGSTRPMTQPSTADPSLRMRSRTK
jgi:hypothetical protein